MLHGAADDGRRRTRLRLGQGAGRIRLADRNLRRDTVYGRHVHRRQPRGAQAARTVQQAGASARARLVAAAARALERPRRRMRGRNGQVTHTPSGRTLDYGALAADAAAGRAADRSRRSSTPEQFTLVGKPTAAARHAGQGQRQARVRHRRAAARHAVRRGRAVPGVRRHADARRRQRDQRHAAASGGGAMPDSGRGGRRQHSGAPSRRSPRCTIVWDEAPAPARQRRSSAGVSRRAGRADGACAATTATSPAALGGAAR